MKRLISRLIITSFLLCSWAQADEYYIGTKTGCYPISTLGIETPYKLSKICKYIKELSLQNIGKSVYDCSNTAYKNYFTIFKGNRSNCETILATAD